MLKSLDRVTNSDLWREVQDRARDDDRPAIFDGESRGRSRVARFGAVIAALAVFGVGAGLAWFAFGPESKEEAIPPAAGEATIPEIVEIDDGYLLYSGEWMGIPWQLVALQAIDPEIRCGDGELAVAYRDADSTSYQSCPSPYFSAEVFLLDGAEGALVIGTAATDVASIGVETDKGRSVSGVILPVDSVLGTGFNAYVIEVSGESPTSILARDGAGLSLQVQTLDLPG